MKKLVQYNVQNMVKLSRNIYKCCQPVAWLASSTSKTPVLPRRITHPSKLHYCLGNLFFASCGCPKAPNGTISDLKLCRLPSSCCNHFFLVPLVCLLMGIYTSTLMVSLVWFYFYFFQLLVFGQHLSAIYYEHKKHQSACRKHFISLCIIEHYLHFRCKVLFSFST